MKHFKTAISSLCVASVVSLASCTSDPYTDQPIVDVPEATEADVAEDVVSDRFEPVQDGYTVQGVVNIDALVHYQNALEDATYTRLAWELYNKDDLSKGLWERVNTSDYVGLSPAVPSAIVLRDGKVWNPVELYSPSDGPTAFAVALDAVCIKLNKEYNVYSSHPFSVDADNYTITIDGRTYGISTADDESLVLSCQHKYNGGRTHNGGLHLDFGFYSKTEALSFEDGQNLGFDSVVEAYDWLIELFEDTFGDKVNRNELYAPMIRFDQPFFYISQLKAERDAFAEE